MALLGFVPQILAILAQAVTGVTQVQGTGHKASSARPDSGIWNWEEWASLIFP